MGSVVGACVGSMCTGICCSACKQCEGQKFGVISRIPYIFLFFIAGLFSIVMSLYGTTALHLKFYTAKICNSPTCVGNGSVYRVSFVLFIFELLHVLIIGAGVISFHWLWFIIKFIIFAGCLTLTFILGDSSDSNEFFQGYADYFARYVSGLYLFLQILIFISYGHKINEYLQENGNELNESNGTSSKRSRARSLSTTNYNGSCNKYFMFLAIITFGLYVISLTLCGLFFVWYGMNKSCGTHRTLISLTIVMVVLSFAISGIRGDGSLFVSAIVSFYVTFLCFSAMQSSEDSTCNVFANYRSSGSLWIGFVFLFISIFYAAFTSDRIGVLWEKNDDEYFLMDDSNDDIDRNSIKMEDTSNKKDVESGYDDIVNDETSIQSNKKDIESKENDDDNEDEKNKIPSAKQQRISNTYFHIILMLASCYFAMLLSDWGTGTKIVAYGIETMWVNIATQYVTVILFWWTVLAPVVCPSRFGQNDDE